MNSFLFIVPTLNSYKDLPKLINSLKEQTYKNWRILFIDGNSNKFHKKFLRIISKEDERFGVIEQSLNSKGIFGAMNQGWNYINKNDWTLFWGSDDWAFSNFMLEDLNNKIIKSNNDLPDLIVCKGTYFSKNGKKERDSYFFKDNKLVFKNEFKKLLFFGRTPPHQATLFSPKLKKSIRNYDLKYFIAGDLKFFLNASSKIEKVKILDFCIVKMKIGGFSSINGLKRLKEVLRAYYEEYRILFFVPFFLRYVRRLLSKFEKCI